MNRCQLIGNKLFYNGRILFIYPTKAMAYASWERIKKYVEETTKPPKCEELQD